MNQEEIPSVIERPLPNGVIYDLSTTGQVRITLPPTSTWSSGLHWHETHTEYLKVVKGSIRVQLDDSIQTITATETDQPEVRVDRYVWHEWRRAQTDGEVVVIERTDPEDGQKALFFWNLNGVILEAPRLLQDPTSVLSRFPTQLRGLGLDWWITLNLWVIFHHLDNVPVFLDAPALFGGSSKGLRTFLRSVDLVISHVLLFFANIVGRSIGIRAVSDRHTPPESYKKWRRDQNEHRRKQL